LLLLGDLGVIVKENYEETHPFLEQGYIKLPNNLHIEYFSSKMEFYDLLRLSKDPEIEGVSIYKLIPECAHLKEVNLMKISCLFKEVYVYTHL
jgi:hypothetical protein